VAYSYNKTNEMH